MDNLKDLRRNYSYASLSRDQLQSSPIGQFQTWFEELHQLAMPEWFEINAMVLSTTDKQGDCSSRVVLLKAVSDDGFTFFTNYQSFKAKQIEENPQVSLNFFWPMMDRQVKVRGVATKVSASVSDAYFNERPASSRLGAIVSEQSSVIADDLKLEDRVNELQRLYSDGIIPRPENWGGYLVKPTIVEFWQGKPSRLHDRFRYQLDGANWKVERLAP